MPGAQPVRVHYGYNNYEHWYEFMVSCRPSSLWRIIPGLGPLIMFRNGALVSFNLTFKLLEESEGAPHGQQRQIGLKMYIESTEVGSQSIDFVMPTKGHKTSGQSQSFFLNGLGHTWVGTYGGTMYSLDVWEPAYNIVNWGMLLLAAGLGGLVGFLMALLAGGSGGQSGIGSNAP